MANSDWERNLESVKKLADKSHLSRMRNEISFSATRSPVHASGLFNDSVNDEVSTYENGETIFQQRVSLSTTNRKGIDSPPRIALGITLDDYDCLFHDFHSVFYSQDSRDGIFDVLAGLVEISSNVIDAVVNEHGPDTVEDIDWLENERNTWRLIYALYRNRMDVVRDQEHDTSPLLCEYSVVNKYFNTSKPIRECQLVIDWLEECAQRRQSLHGDLKLSHYMDRTIAWENTLHQLQNEHIAYSSSRPIVNALDPDAPLRLKKQIHDLDIEDESRLLRKVFMEIRSGKLENAIELCNLCGHAWRAALLQGWMLYNDPNYGTEMAEGGSYRLIPISGNPNRDIWKACAWRLVEESAAAIYWKAIVGALCGHLNAMLPVCQGWEDQLWAYLRTFVDVSVEGEIRSNTLKATTPLPEEYWNFKFTIDEIFSELAGSVNNGVRLEAAKYMRITQQFIITNRIDDLISAMSEWTINLEDSHLIRFCAHFVLCVRMIGLWHDSDRANIILQNYVKVLMKKGDPYLVAFYTTVLPDEEQVKLYTEFLVDIEDGDERQACLKAAEKFDLRIDVIVKKVVKRSRGKLEDRRSGRVFGDFELVSETSEEDLKKISALDWILHYPHLRAEALWEANALIRYFLINKKLDAARLAFNKVPDDSVSVIYDLAFGSPESIEETIDERILEKCSSLPKKDQAAIKEYLCFRAYLDAEERFSNWVFAFHTEKPTAPTEPEDAGNFVEKVAYDQQMHVYEKALARWKINADKQTDLTQSYLYNVLLFPDGGWLVDPVYNENEVRQKQLDTLRRLYLPKVVLLLHAVFHATHRYKDCLKLADVISSEHRQIYKVYTKQDLGELLKKISDSCICLLTEGKDPWGFPIPTR